MQELLYLIVGQFTVSLLMALGALCMFLWAAAAGLLTNVEPVKYQVLDSEGIPFEGIDQDEGTDHRGTDRDAES